MTETTKAKPSPYELVGAKLNERGYTCIPIKPGTKVPASYIAGRWQGMRDWAGRYVDRPPTKFEIDFWSSKPDGGVCLLTGKISGTLVVDLDAEEVVRAVTIALEHTPCIKRGMKGQSLIFRVDDPIGLRSCSFSRRVPGTNRRERLVDILFDGRQTVLPPTIHPDTHSPYQWIGEKALEDTARDELPAFDAEDMARIAAVLVEFDCTIDFVNPEKPLADKEFTADSPHGQLRDYAYKHLSKWVPKLDIYNLREKSNGYEGVAHWRDSNKKKPLAERNRNLSISNSPNGIKDFGGEKQGYSVYQLIAACNICPVGEEFVWLSRATGWTPEVIFYDPQPKKRPEKPILPILSAQGTPLTAIEGLDGSKTPKKPKPLPRGEIAPGNGIAEADLIQPHKFFHPDLIPEDPADVPGLVGDIMKWGLDTAQQPQPLLSLGSAIAILAVVCSRHIMGPTRSGTHLYILTLAPTGAGKNHPQDCIMQALSDANLKRLCGGSGFTAESSIINSLLRQPACIAPIDEVGAFFGRVKSRGASTHESAINSRLRTLWGNSFKAMATIERAQQQREFVQSPCLSLFGASTPEEFYKYLGSEELANGMLNRFLLIQSFDSPLSTLLDRDDAYNVNVSLPSDLVDKINIIYDRNGIVRPQELSATSDQTPDFLMVKWDEFARCDARDIQREIHRLNNIGEDERKAYARTYEISIRLATIMAMGRWASDCHECGDKSVIPLVTSPDMKFGAALAFRSAELMLQGIRDHTAETDRQKWSNNLLAHIRAMKGKATDESIARHMKNAIHTALLKDIMQALMGAAMIVQIDSTDINKHSSKMYTYKVVEKRARTKELAAPKDETEKEPETDKKTGTSG